MADLHFSNFSQKEDQIYHRIQATKDRFFRPFCVFFQKLKLRPEHLSYSGLAMSFFFVVALPFYEGIALLFLILNVVFDGLDGSYARFLKAQSSKGELLDRALDYASFFIMFAGLLYHHFFNPFWGFLYFVNYTVMSFLTILLNQRNVDFPFLPKTKYFIFLFFLILVGTGWNFFDPLLVFFSIYTVVGNLFLFQRLRCSL